jgi:hypothetical protein
VGEGKFAGFVRHMFRIAMNRVLRLGPHVIAAVIQEQNSMCRNSSSRAALMSWNKSRIITGSNHRSPQQKKSAAVLRASTSSRHRGAVGRAEIQKKKQKHRNACCHFKFIADTARSTKRKTRNTIHMTNLESRCGCPSTASAFLKDDSGPRKYVRRPAIPCLFNIPKPGLKRLMRFLQRDFERACASVVFGCLPGAARVKMTNMFQLRMAKLLRKSMKKKASAREERFRQKSGGEKYHTSSSHTKKFVW